MDRMPEETHLTVQQGFLLSMVCGLDYFGLRLIEAPDYAAVLMSVEILRS